MKYTVYTDGSDFKHTTGRLGIGGILVENKEGKLGKKLGEFSEVLSREDIQRDYNTSECSNPFAEMVATYRAIQKFSNIFKPGDEIIFKADYIGVQGWITGKWKAKEKYIAQITNEIKKILSSSPWKIEFQWVKGHQNASIMSPDAYWNREVDKLAKGI